MHLNRFKILFFILIGVVSCITPFEPQIRQADINKYVVSGIVTDRGFPHVYVSMATAVSDPSFKPVSGCKIMIRDDAGNQFPLSENEEGSYSGEIDSFFLLPGKAFRLEVLVPDGTIIESDYETLSEGVEIDSVYFLKREIIVDPLTGKSIKGIQFFLDLDAGSSTGRFFRWEADETWEYRVRYPREWFYDGTVHHIFPADYSRKICWMTVPLKDVYTISTTGLAQNRYERLPLNFIDNYSSGRLLYGYSLLVRQFSISEAAYSYWDQVRINSSNRGSLYQKQPLQIKGNLHNISSPENEVLGYFEVSSVRSKRIFVRNVEDLEIKFIQNCSLMVLLKGLREITIDDYPAWLYGDSQNFSMILLGIECVDCLSLGGTNVKPDFWPW
jgi:hypothetical protein